MRDDLMHHCLNGGYQRSYVRLGADWHNSLNLLNVRRNHLSHSRHRCKLTLKRSEICMVRYLMRNLTRVNKLMQSLLIDVSLNRDHSLHHLLLLTLYMYL